MSVKRTNGFSIFFDCAGSDSPASDAGLQGLDGLYSSVLVFGLLVRSAVWRSPALLGVAYDQPLKPIRRPPHVLQIVPASS